MTWTIYLHTPDCIFVVWYSATHLPDFWVVTLPFCNLCSLFCKKMYHVGTAVAQWLRCCATNRKATGLIPDVVSGLFIDIKYFRSHYGHGVDSASNRNEYQEYFLGVKAASA